MSISRALGSVFGEIAIKTGVADFIDGFVDTVRPPQEPNRNSDIFAAALPLLMQIFEKTMSREPPVGPASYPYPSPFSAPPPPSSTSTGGCEAARDTAGCGGCEVPVQGS